jgi:SAM-dependent methyltransferase
MTSPQTPPANANATAPQAKTVAAPSAAAQYWAEILDPQNIEHEQSGQKGLTLEAEVAFADAPDLRVAAQWMEGGGVPISKGWTMDLGAGLGANGFVLAGRGHRMLAVDSSLGRLRQLRRRAGALGLSGPDRLATVVAAAEALPFADGSVPRIYTKSVLIHSDLPRAVDELARVLPPGGRAALVEPQPGNPFAALYRRFLAPKAWAAITRYFDPEAQREVARPFGVADPAQAVRPIYLFSFLAFVFQFAWPRPGLFHAALRPLNALDDWLFRHWPRLRALAWFGVIQVERPAKRPDA